MFEDLLAYLTFIPFSHSFLIASFLPAAYHITALQESNQEPDANHSSLKNF